ncbi:MAG TPA: glycosyl hydrolase family 28 protein, partial [Desulfuromonadaceae bacterium]|nr:glycosyl hydrolase family 28 protein [Desulfuromonadaceae bacterium]
MSKSNRIAGIGLAAVLWTCVCGAQVFNVKDFGATGNGATVDTSAINNAIKAAHNAGGGVVTFPPGNYRSTSIHLTNNVTLYLSNNAVILAASSGFDSAESNPFSSYQDFGHSHFHNALIWGEKLHDIGIIGPGTIDGDNNLSTSDSPSSGQADKAISLKLCDRVTLNDFTLRQGGHFGILANGCSNLTMNAAKILCSTDRDAFDLISSSHALIINSRIEGSDDSMCLKSDFALGVKLASSDLHVINCSILSTGNNAIQFGSETIGDFLDCSFSGITIGAAGKAGLGVTSQDGSIIDGISFSDITMQHCSTPIFVKLDDQNRPSSDPHPLGRIRNLSFRNITATHSTQNGTEFTSVVHGKSGTPVQNVTFDNVHLTVVGG